jgi:murein DD-endopeptidase MepM/ murein hydrolase activator NlpD
VEAPIAVTAPPPVPAPAPPAPVISDPGPISGVGLSWPIYGPISSYFDGSHPLGIDIDLFNSVGSPIGAATEGTVTFAGGDPCCSYGLYVVIMSSTGIETLYAHFSSIAIGVGSYVSPGQTIGYSGCTGYCTGTHLHFEVIDNGVRVNPLSYLP